MTNKSLKQTGGFKSRNSTQFGESYEFVSEKKQALYQDAAEAYLFINNLDL